MFGNPGETLVLVFKIVLKMLVFTSPRSHNSTKFAVYLAVNRKPVFGKFVVVLSRFNLFFAQRASVIKSIA